MTTDDKMSGAGAAVRKPNQAAERRLDWLEDHKHELWGLWWLCFNTALIAWSIRLFDDHDRSWKPVGLLVWGTLGIAWEGVKVVWRETSMALVELVAEQRCTTSGVVHIWIDEVLYHPAVVDAYHRLKRLQRIDHAMSFADWAAGISARFKERVKKEEAVERVEFSFNGGVLRVNGIERRDLTLYHELLIPDEALKHEHPVTGDEELCYEGLRIRLIVANGLLKLQVGKWTEETAPPEPESSFDWVAWSTITTFPFILNPQDHHFAPRFLFLDYFVEPMYRHGWDKRKKEFFKQARDYTRAIATLESYGATRLWSRLRRQFSEHLEQEGFEEQKYRNSTWRNKYIELWLGGPMGRGELSRWLGETDHWRY